MKFLATPLPYTSANAAAAAAARLILGVSRQRPTSLVLYNNYSVG